MSSTNAIPMHGVETNEKDLRSCQTRTHTPARTHTPGRTFTLIAIVALVLGLAQSAVATHTPQALWQWPTGHAVAVTRAFDPPSMPWLSGHRGVDLQAPIGSTLRAPAEGTVIFSGTVVDRQVLSLMHEGGLRSTYEPVVPLVQVGQVVSAGDPIATVAPGHSPGPLHWGARFERNQYVNPLRMLTGPAVLKPWD